MWRTGLLYLDRGDSSILNALRNAGYDTQQQPGSPSRSPTRRFSMASDTESALEGKLKHDMRAQQGVQHWVVPPDHNGLKFASPRASPRTRAVDPSDGFTPVTDAALFEEPVLYSLDRIKEDERSPDYFSYDNQDKSPQLKDEHEEPVQVQKRRPHHLRTPSTPTIESRIASAQRATRSLPLRAKTNEGLLQLQANTSKPQRPANTHQRRISLGLPIKAANAPADDARHPSPTTRTLNPTTPKRLSKKKGPTSAIQQERDLEYKHRHTFIGTASLDDFLEVLDVSPEHITNKAAIIRAFILLASSERLLARQASLKPDGWSVIARTSSETVDTDYVEQAHAKLGSIVLRQFLDLITFNEEEEAAAMSVVEAFTAASHLDAQASKATGSKAKAFRNWMVKTQPQ
ncbi:hypothetical protein BDW02DRAFT_321224 [Decorospora gaudefroyi]|uniref:Uncharacterized protein n=1 Tax=Decorospora gaudefroyi TaxID=184978 RepID=A0A6A5KMJ4_9PLEO|nr:hypothetical protein BDW02DRAFT_321224 [Decorospora gaudefroyi]